MGKVFVVGAKRSAIGKFNGSLKNIDASELAGSLINNILKDLKVISPDDVNEVILGNTLSAGMGQGLAKKIAIKGGLNHNVCGYSVNMVCGSGMKSMINGYNSILSGFNDIVFCGGVEVMSQAPFLLPHKIRTGNKLGNLNVIDQILNDGLTDSFHKIHMGVTAENIVQKYQISRLEQDEYALSSQLKAKEAQSNNIFSKEIVPIEIDSNKKAFTFDSDEYINYETNIDKLMKLKPVFKESGTVTAGNSSGLNDGASMLLLCSEKILNKFNLSPLAEIISVSQSGLDPLIMGLGPVNAILKLLDKSKVNLSDLDLIEINEAFAAQVLGVVRELSDKTKISKDTLLKKLNVNGGAIALGHPIGASGNRIIVSLIHDLKRKGLEYGLASICVGGGMGLAVLLKSI